MATVNLKKLKRGESLMREGENSSSMYWVQQGTLRLFKKKGAGFIELEIIQPGEVVGDMSFLDNMPRSASVEALQEAEVLEIPRGNFEEFLKAQPSWLNALLNTFVKRLRSTNNRIRELETSSTVYTDGGKVHEFLTARDLLKLFEALLICGLKGEKQADGSVKVRAATLHLHAHHILNTPLAKIAAFTEILRDAGMVRIEKTEKGLDFYLSQTELSERFLYWLNEEHSKPDEQQVKLSTKAMTIGQAIWEFGNLPKDSTEEKFTVDLEAVYQKYSAAKNVKTPWDWLQFGEFVSNKLSEEIRMASASEKTATLALQRFLKLYPCLDLKNRFNQLNEQKRGQG